MAAVCERCRKRYRQHRKLCRRCARETGVLPSAFSTFDRDRLFVERQRAKFAGAQPAPVPAPMEPRTRIADGVEYVVTFDGSIR